MKEKFPLSYRSIQRVKSEEYERFFAQLPEYTLHMNHLGEVQWMTAGEFTSQHEFFPYELSAWERLKKRYRLKRKISPEKLPRAERELRLYFRSDLQQKYPQSKSHKKLQFMPSAWTYDITEQELENIPLILNPGNAALWKRLGILAGALLLVTVIAVLWILHQQSGSTGQLLVRSNGPGGRVYLDGSRFLGYTDQIIRKVPPGTQRIVIRKEGYSAVPEFHEIQVIPDSLITLEVEFSVLRSGILGYVRIIAEQADSKIFINGQYKGTLAENPVLALEGSTQENYRITVEKSGFLTFPPEKQARVLAGDTTIISFHQVFEHGQARKPSGTGPENVGSIAVSSNVKGAGIFLNGRDTGQKTDHIFTQLHLGKYSIQVRKEGYGIDPQLLEIDLTRSDPGGNAYFTLSHELEMVRISTQPTGGKIFIDGEWVGEGKFEGQLPLGQYHVTFGDITGYKKPTGQAIALRAGSPVNLSVIYFPELRISAGVNNRGNIFQENCQVLLGHTFKDRAFTPSTEGAPAVEFYSPLNDYYWKMGFAFAYRNPKGNDAVKLIFELPKQLHHEQKFTLRIHAAGSRDKYPFAISTNTDITIKFNNTILSYEYSPKMVEDLSQMEVRDWDITPHTRGGTNSVEIFTTDKNNTYYFLKKIEIFN